MSRGHNNTRDKTQINLTKYQTFLSSHLLEQITLTNKEEAS